MAKDSTPRICRAAHGDRAQILRADVFDEAAQPDSLDRFLGPANAPDPRNLLYLAELDGKTVGFVSGTMIDHPDKPTSLFINELGVNEEARRRGIAKALVTAIRAEGQRLGCQSTWVLTEADNAPALALYRALDSASTGGVVMFEWDETPSEPE